MRLLANHKKLLLCLAAMGLAFPANRIKAAEEKIAGTLALQTAADRLLFDRGSGRFVSLRGTAHPEVELLATSPDQPAFAIRYFDEHRADHLLDSRNVKAMSVDCSGPAEDKTLTLRYSGVGGFDWTSRWPSTRRRATASAAGPPACETGPVCPSSTCSSPSSWCRGVATARWCCPASADSSARSQPSSNCRTTASVHGG